MQEEVATDRELGEAVDGVGEVAVDIILCKDDSRDGMLVIVVVLV